MNINPFFSIVIPVYNGLSHNLERCLDRIWEQPLSCSLYEVICVDDCSIDNTRKWLNEQKKVHNNLFVIENEYNMCQGGARNRGIKFSRGQYVMLIDQDDYYEKNIFEQLYSFLIKNELDFLVTSNTWELEGRPSSKIQGIRKNSNQLTGENFLRENGPVFVPWKFVFKRDFVIEKNLFLRENVSLGEDIDWTFKMFLSANKVQYQPFILVHYVRGLYNTSNQTNRLQILIACTSIFNFIENLNCKDDIREISYSAINYFLKSTLYNMFCFNGYKEKIFSLTNCIGNIPEQKINLLKFAFRFPKLFCFISEIVAPFLKLIFPLYRKYQIKFVWPKLMY